MTESPTTSSLGGKKTGDDRLIPVRMLNEVVYCPRLAHLEWIQGEWATNLDVLEGQAIHRRVSGPDQAAPPPGAEGEDEEVAWVARSVRLSDPELGITGVLDLVEGEAGAVVPVDYKRSKAPKLKAGAWDPERVQVCAQVLLLRANGYRCDRGFLYFAGSRKRVEVEPDDELIALTHRAIEDSRDLFERDEAPEPLTESPKCPRCSLVGICLPDEMGHLRGAAVPQPRRLFPAREAALPLHVIEQGSRLGRRQERLVVTRGKEELGNARLLDVSHVCLYGNVQVTAQALGTLLEAGVPVVHLSYGGRLRGFTVGPPGRNVMVRLAQYRSAHDPTTCLTAAREIVAGKIYNQRVLIRRNHPEPPDELLKTLKNSVVTARRAPDLDTLLGIEGDAAHRYFRAFADMLRSEEFSFESRNRRPPRDPVNAVLSFLYSMLLKETSLAIHTVGLDIGVGLYHQVKAGRPALALDLMEEFRPIVADSVALTLFNTKALTQSDFVRAAKSCTLTKSGRTTVIQAHERRMDTLVQHPTFGYRITYRRVIEVQARLLARFMGGEIPRYQPFTVR